jgi:hypothetical protein
MDLRDTTILILGGSGLVGQAVARRLLGFGPRKVALVALTEDEVRRAAAVLETSRGSAELVLEWGNIFFPEPLAKGDRATATADPGNRHLLIGDLFGELTDDVLARSLLFRIVSKHRPAVVIDCINTATAFAYLDLFQSARDLLVDASDGHADRAAVEEHLLTLPIPQLIRHVQVLVESLKRAGTRAYVKIGTSGTGGMGFNVPYTHSEERPSRTLLTKSAVAGAHSLLLFLMGRTPGAPATIEIKPTATIAWREIGFGPIRRGGRPVQLIDCPEPVAVDLAFRDGGCGWQETGEVLESVYVDLGENGLFARDEFETVTALGQMECVTPEEIADLVSMELEGRPTGRDIVAALDAATLGPTYRAGVLRQHAIARLRALEEAKGVRSVAFEMLGPPRLTKLLYEAHLWALLRGTVDGLAESDPEQLAHEAGDLLASDRRLRSQILSVGIPVLLADGRVYRGATVVVPPNGDGDPTSVASRGWVDLRPMNVATWIARAQAIAGQARERGESPTSGSDVDWFAMAPSDTIEPARMATWVFRHEDQGERIKR